MIEGVADVPEEDFKKALHFAQAAVTKIVEAQEELVKLAGKEKREYTVTVAKEDLLEIGYQVAGDRIEDAIYAASKVERGKKVGALRDEVEAAIKEKYPETTDFEIEQVFEYIQKKAFRVSIMEKGIRADGRKHRELRPLYGEVGTFPACTVPIFCGETRLSESALWLPPTRSFTSTITLVVRTRRISSSTTTSRRSLL